MMTIRHILYASYRGNPEIVWRDLVCHTNIHHAQAPRGMRLELRYAQARRHELIS